MHYLKSFYLQSEVHELYILGNIEVKVKKKKADSWLKLSLITIGLLYAQPLFMNKLALCSSKTLTELLYLVFQYLVPIFNNENKMDYSLLHVAGLMK